MDWKELKKGNWVKFWYPDQPIAATMDEWAEFEQQQQLKPVAFFFAETLPDFFRHYFIYPYKNTRDRIYEWFFHQPVLMIKSLKAGWHNKDEFMIHANFQILVDYVEIDCANENAWCNSKLKRPSRLVRYLTEWRNPQYGLDWLLWCTTLDQPGMNENERSPVQAANAREVLALYNWWKYHRPARPDPMDISGWSAHCALMETEGRSIFSERSDEERRVSKQLLETLSNIEQQYYNEDEAMLVRLIKIRYWL